MKKLGQYPDGSLKLDTTDVRSTEQKLKTLSFKEKLDLMYPTSEERPDAEWQEYDTHKLFK